MVEVALHIGTCWMVEIKDSMPIVSLTTCVIVLVLVMVLVVVDLLWTKTRLLGIQWPSFRTKPVRHERQVDIVQVLHCVGQSSQLLFKERYSPDRHEEQLWDVLKWQVAHVGWQASQVAVSQFLKKPSESQGESSPHTLDIRLGMFAKGLTRLGYLTNPEEHSTQLSRPWAKEHPRQGDSQKWHCGIPSGSTTVKSPKVHSPDNSPSCLVIILKNGGSSLLADWKAERSLLFTACAQIGV